MKRISKSIPPLGIDISAPHVDHRLVSRVARAEHTRRREEREPGPLTVYMPVGMVVTAPIATQPPMSTPPVLRKNQPAFAPCHCGLTAGTCTCKSQPAAQHA